MSPTVPSLTIKWCQNITLQIARAQNSCHTLLQGIPEPGMEAVSPALQADSLPTELQGSYLGLRRNVISVGLVTS